MAEGYLMESSHHPNKIIYRPFEFIEPANWFVNTRPLALSIQAIGKFVAEDRVLLADLLSTAPVANR